MLVKANARGRLRSSALLGVFACAGFVGAASWTAFNSSSKSPITNALAISAPVAKYTKESAMNLHMSYELGSVKQVQPVSKAVTQIALNDVGSSK